MGHYSILLLLIYGDIPFALNALNIHIISQSEFHQLQLQYFVPEPTDSMGKPEPYPHVVLKVSLPGANDANMFNGSQDSVLSWHF